MADEDTLPEGLEGIDIEAFSEVFKEGNEETPPVLDAPEPKVEAKAEPAAAKEETPKKWVHEVTGKEFDNETDYLKYDSGYNNQKFGEELKTLREQLENLKGQKETSAPKQSETEAEIRDKMIGQFMESRVPENLRTDENLQLIRDMSFEFLKNYDQMYVTPQLTQLMETIQKLESSTQEQSLRSELGVDPSVEAQILEKHSGLKALSPKERMAVIKDLASQSVAPSRDTSNRLIDKIPQQRAEDHVEGSAKSSPPEGESGEFDNWLKTFDKKDIEDQELTLTKMIQKAHKSGVFDD